MKKLLIVLAFVGVCVSSFAQDEDPAQKYSVATNSFWSNWFFQANADWSAFYSNEEHGSNLAASPLKSFRATPNFSLALGKWFTPGLGLRTKFYGVWARQVLQSEEKNSYKYWNLQEQVLFNLSNIFCGYNPSRVWNLTVFVGEGADRNWDTQTYAMTYSFGLMNQWRLSNHLSLNLEIGRLMKEHSADGVTPNTNNQGNRFWEGHDNQLYAEVGLTFKLGKTGWEHTPDVEAIQSLSQAQLDALNAQLADANEENDRLKELLSNQKPTKSEPQVVKEYTGIASVFFNLDKADIASKKDLVNLESMVEFAKENGATLRVTGYADSKTGSVQHNQTLSEKRANAVADELVKMGVSRDNIQVVAKGGVVDLSPVSYNRRATVEVVK